LPLNTYSSRIETRKLDNIASLAYKSSYENPGSNNYRLGLNTNATENSVRKMSPNHTPSNPGFSSYFNTNYPDNENQNHLYSDYHRNQTTLNDDMNLSSETYGDSKTSQHSLNNKIYKMFKLAKKNEGGQFRIHLDQAERIADHQNSELDPGSQSIINSTEERSTKRRVCLRSKSTNRASQPSLPSVAFDTQQDQSIKSTQVNSFSNKAFSEEFNHQRGHPVTLGSSDLNKEENYLSCIHPKPMNICSRELPHSSHETTMNLQYTESNERTFVSENLNKSRSQSAKPAIKHRILLQSSSKKREKSADSLVNLTQQSPNRTTDFASFTPPKNQLAQVDNSKVSMPISGFWTFNHCNNQNDTSQKQDLINQNSTNLALNDFGKCQDFKNGRNLEYQFSNKDFPTNFGSSRRQRQSLSEEKTKDLSIRQLSMPSLHISNFNQASPFKIQEPVVSNTVSKKEQDEDRIVPLRDIVRKKHEEYKTKLKNLLPYNSNNSENTKRSCSETNRAIFSVERKKSFDSFNPPSNHYETNLTSRLDTEKDIVVQGSQVKEENRRQYRENCQSVLSDINQKIEGILQKCCELTERSVKGLEKLSTGNIVKHLNSNLIDRLYTSPRIHTIETGRDNFTETGKIKIGNEIFDWKKERLCWSGTSKDEFVATLERNEIFQNEGFPSQRLWTEEKEEDILEEDKRGKTDYNDNKFKNNPEVDRISEEDEENNETCHKESKVNEDEVFGSAKNTLRNEQEQYQQDLKTSFERVDPEVQEIISNRTKENPQEKRTNQLQFNNQHDVNILDISNNTDKSLVNNGLFVENNVQTPNRDDQIEVSEFAQKEYENRRRD